MKLKKPSIYKDFIGFCKGSIPSSPVAKVLETQRGCLVFRIFCSVCKLRLDMLRCFMQRKDRRMRQKQALCQAEKYAGECDADTWKKDNDDFQ